MKGDKVVVIGAGPAGLTAAFSLASRGYSVTIIERSNSVGGMARSMMLWGKIVDIGPHRFFSDDARVNKFYVDALDGEYCMVQRLTRIYYGGKFFSYPLKAGNALIKLGLFESVRCLSSYLFRQIKPKKNEEKFDSWVINRFGDRLFEIFFKSYTEKLWGISVDDLDSEFAAQRIKKFSLWEAAKTALYGSRKNEHRTLVDEFAYPLEGAGLVYEKLRTKFQNLSGVIKFETTILSLERKENEFVLDLSSGERETCDHLISTMPITDLVTLLEAPVEVLDDSRSLSFRNTILIYLEISGQNPFPDQWIYVHSSALNTGRITNFSNWIGNQSDQASHILCLEYWCYDSDQIWGASEEDLIKMARKELSMTGLVLDASIGNGKVLRVPKSYPVYRTGYKDRLLGIQDFISSIPRLYAIGRYGSFKYNNQDHSILMGLLAAENIAEEGAHDLWALNSDYEYQESSRISVTGLLDGKDSQ